MTNDLRANRTPRAILLNMLIAAVSLFVNGFGVYLTTSCTAARPSRCP